MHRTGRGRSRALIVLAWKSEVAEQNANTIPAIPRLALPPRSNKISLKAARWQLGVFASSTSWSWRLKELPTSRSIGPVDVWRPRPSNIGVLEGSEPPSSRHSSLLRPPRGSRARSTFLRPTRDGPNRWGSGAVESYLVTSILGIRASYDGKRALTRAVRCVVKASSRIRRGPGRGGKRTALI